MNNEAKSLSFQMKNKQTMNLGNKIQEFMIKHLHCKFTIYIEL